MANDHLYGDEHVARYRETDGAEGYIWRNDSKILLLTTKGRKSGEERTHALIFEPDGDDPVIVASKGGAPQHPAWYLNLKADPTVTVQIKGDVFTATARDATPEERPRMWEKLVAAWPDYEAYQAKTDREIPLVVLERAA